MTQPIEKTVLRVVSLAGLAICVVLALWGWKTGILTSQERMEHWWRAAARRER